MKHSETMGKLAAALAKAQAEIGAATMDAKNPFFKSKYATLGAVMAACREPLSKAGIAVVQGTCDRDEAGNIVVTTMLVHSSGEWIKSSLPLRPSKEDAQQIGSCISYGRRYLLASMAGVWQDDDDGEGAVGRPEHPTPTAKKAAKKTQPPAPPKPPVSSDRTAKLEEIFQRSQSVGETPAEMKTRISALIGKKVGKSSDIEDDRLDEILKIYRGE